MRIPFLFLVLAGMVFLSERADARQVSVGTSVGEAGLRDFYFAVGDYFKVTEREVTFISERTIPNEEVPVVLFIGARARVASSAVIDLRLDGRSWMDITFHFKLNPEIYYMPVKVEVKGWSYGKPYGYYRNRHRKDWGKIVLSNPEIINLVNLRFISEYHQVPPEEVIKMREWGKSFIVINDEVKKGKAKEKEKGPKENDKGEGKGKGKGNK